MKVKAGLNVFVESCYRYFFLMFKDNRYLNNCNGNYKNDCLVILQFPGDYLITYYISFNKYSIFIDSKYHSEKLCSY